jgi:hypothetical protein
MNKSIAVLAIILLLINGAFIIIAPEEDIDDWLGGDDPGNGPDAPTVYNVTVPPIYHGDTAKYFNELYAEVYWINFTTGNFTQLILEISGKVIMEMQGQANHEDGFGIMHQVLPQKEHIEGAVTARYVTHEQNQTIPGYMEIDRYDYRDLHENRIIKSITDGTVGLDRSLRETIELDYNGKLRSYPDPNEPLEETLDEEIFGDQKPIVLNASGDIEKAMSDEDSQGSFYNTIYHWKAVSSEAISGYSTIRINIDATFGETDWQLPFSRQVWIANDISLPVKIYTRTNQSWQDEDGKFYFILENTRTLKPDGFTRGKVPVAWDQCEGEHYKTINPMGDYQNWKYLPKGGTKIDESSFDFNPDEAISIAIRDSPSLQEFIEDRNEDVIVEWAQYNSTHDPQDVTLTGSHRWLFLFAHELSTSELEKYEDKDERPQERYAIQVTYNTTKLGLTDTKEVENDYGFLNWTASMSKDDLSQKMLTVAAAEEIMKSDSDVYLELYNDPLAPDKIYWDDKLGGQAQLYLSQGIQQEETPGIGVIEILTGFTIPTSKFSWSIQKGQLLEESESGSADTFAVVVDAETGRLQYVLKVTGTSLSFLLG